MKILFLQSAEYFEDLGVHLDVRNMDFCLVFSFNIRKRLREYDLIVSCIEHDLSARKVIDYSNSLGIPTAFIMDGVFDFTNSTNNSMLKKLKVTQFSPFIYGNIFLLGDKFANYIKNSADGVQTYNFLPKRAGLEIYNKRKVANILLTTANTPYFNDQEKVRLKGWLLKTIQLLEEQNISIKLRLFDVSLLDCNSLARFNNDTSETLSSAVSSVDCVICTPSTVIHSLTLYKIPNVTLNYRNDELLYDTDCVISKEAELPKLISFISNTFDYKIDLNFNVTTGLNLSDYDYNCSNRAVYVPKMYLSLSSFTRVIYKKLPKKFAKFLKGFV